MEKRMDSNWGRIAKRLSQRDYCLLVFVGTDIVGTTMHSMI